MLLQKNLLLLASILCWRPCCCFHLFLLFRAVMQSYLLLLVAGVAAIVCFIACYCYHFCCCWPPSYCKSPLGVFGVPAVAVVPGLAGIRLLKFKKLSDQVLNLSDSKHKTQTQKLWFAKLCKFIKQCVKAKQNNSLCFNGMKTTFNIFFTTLLSLELHLFR
jgi:hypothetical protein